MRTFTRLKDLLDSKVELYNNPGFISSDPISVPHCFSKKEDIEIAGFLTAIISWGRRDQIIKKAKALMELMDNDPFEFIINAGKIDIKNLESYCYRTFNSNDLIFLVYALRNIYQKYNGLENVANDGYNQSGHIRDAIIAIRSALLKTPHLQRSEKHLANPNTGSAAKRLNMFLRWMIRQDEKGVDFGIWKNIPPRALMCPLDLHVGKVARNLGLLERKQNDWKAVEELTSALRAFDPKDPVKYDFALFGLGVFES